MNTFTTRARAGMAIGAAVLATGGIVAASTPSAHAATSARACNSATTHAGFTMPGYNGQRVPCYLNYGSSGATVRVLQRFLNAAGDSTAGAGDAHIAVDGHYGPATKAKIQRYQKAWNNYPCASSGAVRKLHLAVDGSWGPRTSTVSQSQLAFCGD